MEEDNLVLYVYEVTRSVDPQTNETKHVRHVISVDDFSFLYNVILESFRAGVRQKKSGFKSAKIKSFRYEKGRGKLCVGDEDSAQFISSFIQGKPVEMPVINKEKHFRAFRPTELGIRMTTTIRDKRLFALEAMDLAEYIVVSFDFTVPGQIISARAKNSEDSKVLTVRVDEEMGGFLVKMADESACISCYLYNDFVTCHVVDDRYDSSAEFYKRLNRRGGKKKKSEKSEPEADVKTQI